MISRSSLFKRRTEPDEKPVITSEYTGEAQNDSVIGDSSTSKIRSDTVARALRFEVEHWLDWQSRMISGVLCGGVFLLNSDGRERSITAIEWPLAEAGNKTSALASSPQLQKIAQQVIDSRSNVIQKADSDESEEADYVGCTISSGDFVTGAVVFALSHRTESQRVAVLQLVQWCVIWLESQLNSSIGAHENTHELTQTAISMISDDGPFPVVGNAVCTLLAERFGCSLVSLGLKSGLQVRLAAVSHRMIFDRRSNSMNLLEVAMEECIDQEKRLIVPSNSASNENVVHAHLQALKNSDYAQIVSVPIIHKENVVGVLMLGRLENDAAFDQTQLSQLDTLTERIAPIIIMKRMSETAVSKRVVQSIRHGIIRLTGPSNYKFKAISAFFLCAVILLTALDTNRIVPATAVIEGETQQAIVVQADSFVQSVGARAGDRVKKGQVLATLNVNGLRLEREKWQSELIKREGEHLQAWALKDPAQVTIASSRIDQSKAKLAQIDTQIEQSRMQAPFDGYLINGDLSQSIGAPVTRGQVIFEIIPNANYKLVLDIDEHRISQVKIGQSGTLRLNGVPGKRVELEVRDVLPVASTKNGKSVFRVEADVIDAPADLRPGLHGVAKLVVGRGSFLSVWTEEFRRKLRLFLWYYGF